MSFSNLLTAFKSTYSYVLAVHNSAITFLSFVYLKVLSNLRESTTASQKWSWKLETPSLSCYRNADEAAKSVQSGSACTRKEATQHCNIRFKSLAQGEITGQKSLQKILHFLGVSGILRLSLSFIFSLYLKEPTAYVEYMCCRPEVWW